MEKELSPPDVQLTLFVCTQLILYSVVSTPFQPSWLLLFSPPSSFSHDVKKYKNEEDTQRFNADVKKNTYCVYRSTFPTWESNP